MEGMERFPVFFFLVEFKCFVIRILDVWFHKRKISLWDSTTGAKEALVSEWRKSGQTEVDWQRDTVGRKKSVKPEAGNDFLI